MAAIITKQLAREIAEKLGAVLHPKKKRPHDLYVVYHEGQRITQFGIRRASKKGTGHDHVPPAIALSPAKARLLGQCPMTREQWVEEMIEKGVIQTTHDALGSQPETPPGDSSDPPA